jgi:hypothetical protein
MARTSAKRVQIDKANATMLGIVVASSFITVFSLVSFRALWSQRGYQSKVISKKEDARDQLKKNIDASKKLVTSYRSFVSTSQNVIGGNPNGQGEKDGDNAKIVLDALPSKYDFPALATSVEKLLGQNGLQILKIEGKDDEVAQEQNKGSANPQPVIMDFTISVEGTYPNVQKLVSLFESSIRPFKVNTLTFSGKDSDLVMEVKAQTFYQPAKSLKIETEVVR